MVASGKSPNPGPALLGRADELARVQALLDAARDGSGGALVVTGDPGIGKTALLTAAVAAADGFCHLSTVGIESEAVLGCAGLLDLLSPLRRRLTDIPPAQADALTAVLGWGPAPTTADPFLVAAGTLSLLAKQAERQPVLVVVDDAHWVDVTSVAAVAFAARRLAFDPVVVIVAARADSPVAEQLAGLPVQSLAGVSPSTAARLLPSDTSVAVVDELTRSTHGNPLALMEVGRALSRAQRMGAAHLPDQLPVGMRIGRAFAETLRHLSPGCRRTLLLCAVNPAMSPAAPLAAARRNGDDADSALAEAELAGVVSTEGGELRFRHPLIRSAVLAAATPDERRAAHRALAAVLPPGHEASAERVWHEAQGTVGPDEALATELVAVADARRVRHGYAESSLVLERAALLTGDPPVSSQRLADALEDAFLAGDLQRTRALAETVLAATADAPTRGQVRLTLGVVEKFTGSVRRAVDLLATAATECRGRRRVRALAELAEAQFRLGDYPALGDTVVRLVAAADDTDPEQRLLSCFLQGVGHGVAGDFAAGAPFMREVMDLAFGPALGDDPRFLVYWALAAAHLGLEPRAMEAAEPRLLEARRRGAVGILVPLLSLSSGGRALVGDHARAYADAGEAIELGEHLGYAADVAVAFEMVAWQQGARGRHDEARAALRRAVELTDRAETTTVHAHYAITAAFCALSRQAPADAVAILEPRLAADGGAGSMGEPLGIAPQLVEAYAALDRLADAAALTAEYAASTPPYIAHDRAMLARCQALAAGDDDEAFAAFARALAAHAEGVSAFETARTRLLYGERLRRAGRRVDARVELRAALETFTAHDLRAWADRATAELDATGATARSRQLVATEPLTSQETRVALLVAQGLSNREVAAALFLSPKTVEHHLGSVFRKRGYRSRAELAASFAQAPSA
ncbi:MAG TPA: LuxR family transcriptional regulator [Lapillicoccus sp.]|nr:LuxR family transcriptional regulator [Lapillicoccus sp.]